ncbi:hypothetical protein B0A49_10078 [Cryomyces minteri]|uniref:Amino acid permease/ SLC12A domain-containing protein n=1 Tax=Cryomyces minteri TaxID=331657 RepID=A0A4U0WKI2_9PEZI|nr:hypothetical protein B0A49_10078 [Cryomyces minteri]
MVLKPGSAAIIAIIFGEYMVRAAIGADAVDASTWINKGVALAGLVSVTLLNSVSTKLGTRSADIFMFLKFVALLGVTITGIVVAVTGLSFNGKASDDWKTKGWFEGTNTNVSNWAVALYAGLWAFDGWDNVNYVTGEFKNPSRDLPRVIHTSLPLVILSYILANIAYFFVLPLSVIESSNTVAVAFGSKVFGPIGSLILALTVSGSCFGALNATTFTSGRLVYAAGKEGYLPAVFGKIGIGNRSAVKLHTRSKTSSRIVQFVADDVGFFYTPIAAMALNAALTSVYIVVGDFKTLTTFYGVAGYTFYFLTVLGLIVLRVKEPMLERPYRTWITTPIIFCCVSLFLLSRAVFAEPLQTVIVVAFVVAGVPVYFWRVGGRDRGRKDEGVGGRSFEVGKVKRATPISNVTELRNVHSAMFDLPNAKRVRRSDLQSPRSSPRSSPDSALLDLFRTRVQQEHEETSAPILPTLGNGNNGFIDDHAEELEFRLFASTSKAAQAPTQKIRLRSPSLDAGGPGFIQPHRTRTYYFTGSVSPERLTEYSRAAVSGQDVLARAQSPWPGCAYSWKVRTLTGSGTTVPLSSPAGLLNGPSKASRKRAGKKRRIKLRKAAVVEREKQALRGRSIAEKEAAEREKRTRRNREKKVKKKVKEKAKKAATGMGGVEGGAGGESQGMLVSSNVPEKDDLQSNTCTNEGATISTGQVLNLYFLGIYLLKVSAVPSPESP